MSKNLYIPLLLFFLIGTSCAYSQTTIRGKVRDAETGKPLEFTNVALLNPSDSTLITGAMSGANGNFSIETQPGNYLVRAGFMGYQLAYKRVEVGNEPVNVGNLRLAPTEEMLEEVTVTGVQSMFKSDIDKRTYNVENSILAEGASASELLNTLPSIQIDEEGGISMRGSGNVLIYINGRPTNLSSEETESILAQFPANSIKNVELITNPSSRYDAQGVGGIINIILKKDERMGVNGQVNAAVGTRDKYQTGFNINYGVGNFNLYSSYNYQYRNLFEISESLRRTQAPNVSPFLDQDFNTDAHNQSHLFRLGGDYYINENATIGVYGQFNRSSRDRSRIYNQRHQDINRNLDSLYNRTLTEDQFSRNIETGITFNYDLDTIGQQLYASFSYANNEQERTEFFDQLFFNTQREEVPQNRQDQIYGRPSQSDLFIGQVDYTKPFSGGGRLEAGLKTTMLFNNLAQTFDQLDLSTGIYIPNDTITNRFTFEELVHAGYLVYRNRFNKFAYQAGIRAEQTFTTGFDLNTDQEYVNNYFNIFPSLYTTYDLGNNTEILANYSRRINRPGAGQMAPFYNAQDLLNTRFGNPMLQPEFTDSYEAGLNKEWDWLLFTGTAYHRRTTNAMTRIISLLNNNAAVQLWENAASRRDTGLELINQFQFSQTFDATLSGNFFYSEVFGDNIRENFNNSNFTWTLSLLSNYVIPNVVTLQLMADYRGPIILPQGEIEPIYGLNIGARRDLWNKRATISLNVTDVFNTRVFRVRTDDISFSQERYFNRETRIGTLSFVWRFGGFKSREDVQRERYPDDPF